MAHYQFIVLSQAKPGQDEEFVRWYRDQHLVDVAKQPGVLSAKLFETDYQKVYTLAAPQWKLLTIYELESDDPEATVDMIRAKFGSPEMPMSDSLDKTGMIILVGHQIGEAG